MAGVVGAGAILIVLAWLPGLFRNLPSAVLAAIVLAAAFDLFEVVGVVRLVRTRPGEFLISLAALAGIAVFGVIPGIGLAVAVSLLAFVRRGWVAHVAELVRVDDMKGYHDVARHPEGRRIPEVLLVRFDPPLFFANAELFQRTVLQLAADRGGVRWIVITAEPITDIDATATQALSDMVDDLEAQDIVLAFGELKGRVRVGWRAPAWLIESDPTDSLRPSARPSGRPFRKLAWNGRIGRSAGPADAHPNSAHRTSGCTDGWAEATRLLRFSGRRTRRCGPIGTAGPTPTRDWSWRRWRGHSRARPRAGAEVPGLVAPTCSGSTVGCPAAGF